MKLKKLTCMSLICLLCTGLFSFDVSASQTAAETLKEEQMDQSFEIMPESNNYPDWPEGPSIYAKSGIIMDAETGTVLYNKNMDEKQYPASITKIMTALLALENSKPDDMVTFSRTAVLSLERGSSNIGIKEGEQLTMEQCLYGLMLASANEAANGIAEHISGTISDFTNLMNERAKALGCKNTNFANPHGLQNENHYTTAYDMALITREALKNEKLKSIMGTYTYVIPPTNITAEERPLTNHHKMLPQRPYAYKNCIGGKTGYTTASGSTLVTCAEDDSKKIISVLLAGQSKEYYKDAEKTLDYGLNDFKEYDAVDTIGDFQDEYKALIQKNHVKSTKKKPYVMLSEKSHFILPNSVDYNKIKISYNNPDEENPLGTVTYYYKDLEIGTGFFELTNSKENSICSGKYNVEKNKTKKKAEKKSFFSNVFVIVVFLFFVAILSYLFKYKKRSIYNYLKKLRKNKSKYKRR